MQALKLFFKVLIVFFTCFSTVLIVSCDNRGKKLESALKHAGANKVELLKVIDHYQKDPADSLKLKAARYLIENMPYHFSYDTSYLHNYRPVIEEINSLRGNGFSQEIIKAQVNPVMDSLISVYPLANVYSKRENDLTSIESKMLINNIDLAFEYYNNNPFKDSVLFDDFLEYILPYRVQNGYCLEDSRSYFINRYSDIIEQDFASVHQLCDSLLYRFKDVKIGWRIADNFPYLKLEDYLKSRMTHCPQKCWFNCMFLRSFGMPVTIDFVPASRVHTVGHEWNTIKLKDGVFPFDPFWVGLNNERYLKQYYSREKFHPVIGPIQFPKIYRKTYKANISELLEHAMSTGEDIPPLFQNPFMKDVTEEYFKTFSTQVTIIKNIKDHEYLYACVVGDKQNWVPVDFGKIMKGKVSFSSLGSRNVYLPAYYKFGSMIPASHPVLLNEYGSLSLLKPDTTVARQVTITHVAYPRPELKDYKEAFIGATIEGSNDKNFDQGEVLYRVKDAQEPGFYHIPLQATSSYRFIRFVIPKKKIWINEIRFLEIVRGNKYDVKGKRISSHPEDSMIYKKITDGELKTGTNFLSIKTENNATEKIWVGYEFKKRISLNAFELYFVFGANIRNEGIYELLYWDFEWKSLGKKISNSTNPISFDNVPGNTLLMVKIHDTDSYSRPFTYSEGEQHWW